MFTFNDCLLTQLRIIYKKRCFSQSYSVIAHKKKICKNSFSTALLSQQIIGKTEFQHLRNNNDILRYHYSTIVTPSNNISLTRVKHILNTKKMIVKDGFTCLQTKCIFCLEKDRTQEGFLFINKVTGYFLCNKCKAGGSWDYLEKSLNKEKPNVPSEKNPEISAQWVSVCEKCESLQNLPTEKVANVLKRFNFKKRHYNELIKLDPLVDQSATHIYVRIKNGDFMVGMKELTCDGGETMVPNVGCKGVLMIKSEQPKITKKEAVIVHTVRDMLAVASYNLPVDVISLPHGLINLPQEVLPLLEDYTKITLWFGNTDGHWESARHFAKKLNEQRCYFVRPTKDHPAPFEGDIENKDLSLILQSALPIAHKSITHFSHLREDVLSHLQNIDKAAGVRWTRFPSLNNILKGHRRGEMTVLTGPSGVGKTTLMSEYSLDLAMQGVTTLWGSFEIRNERLARTMLQQLCRFPLHQHLDKFDKWADAFQLLPIYFLTFHGQQPLKTVMEAVQHAAYVHDIAHVIIDNVQFMMGISEGDNSLDRFYKQDSIIGAFRNFATTANCHVTLVVHPRKEKDQEMLSMNSVFGGVKATQEADNVLIIQQKTLNNLKLKKFLQIAKNRYNGDLGVMPLDFDKDSLSFAQKQQKVDTSVELDDPLSSQNPTSYY